MTEIQKSDFDYGIGPGRLFQKSGVLVNFVYLDADEFDVAGNVRRLILLNQEKALELWRKRKRSTWARGLRVLPYAPAQVVIAGVDPIGNGTLAIYLDSRTAFENMTTVSDVNVQIAAVTDPGGSREASSLVARAYLSAIRSMFLSVAPREFVWRPRDEEGGETAADYAAYVDRRLPTVVKQMTVSFLDDTQRPVAGAQGVRFALNLGFRLTIPTHI